jgi:hypothetical protein
MLRVAWWAAAVAAAAADSIPEGADEDTDRRQLFSNPTRDLPDVYVSETIHYGSEGDSFEYTVHLTHPPGARPAGPRDCSVAAAVAAAGGVVECCAGCGRDARGRDDRPDERRVRTPSPPQRSPSPPPSPGS